MKKLFLIIIILMLTPIAEVKAQFLELDLRVPLLVGKGIVQDIDKNSNYIYVSQQKWMYLPYADKRRVLNAAVDYMSNQTGRNFVEIRSYQHGNLLMTSKYNVEPPAYIPYQPYSNGTMVPVLPNNQYGTYNQINQYNQFTINGYGY